MENILVFIPMYNCEKQITRVLDQFDNTIIKHIHEIILINNRSTDNTEKRALEYLENTDIPAKLLRNNENYGLGGSHKIAFKYAKEHGFDYVIVLHGDDQGDIKNILPILENKIYKEYDCCLGARFMKKSKLEGYSKFRTLGNLVYDLLFSIIVRKRVYDLGSGLNMYDVRMLKDDFFIKFPDNLMFNYCMIMASHFYNHNLMFFPILWREADQVSNVKMLNQAVNVLKMLAKYAMSKEAFIKSEMRKKLFDNYEAQLVKDEVV